MNGDARGFPRLHEEHTPRKGYVLLIPWMLMGALWLKLSTGLNQSDLTFYFSLLVAGAISLMFLIQNEPKVNDQLARLKLLPFVWAFGLAMAGVIAAVTAIRLLSAGSVTFNHFQLVEIVNFIAVTCLIIAPIETLVFQFIMPKITTMSLHSIDTSTKKGVFQFAMLGGVVSQFTFAGFHYAAYNHDLGSMGFAFALGLGFYTLVLASPEWGLGAAMGAHAGWNIIVGIFSGSLGQAGNALGHIINDIIIYALPHVGNLNAILGGIL